MEQSSFVHMHSIVGALRKLAHSHPYKFSEQRTLSLLDFKSPRYQNSSSVVFNDVAFLKCSY